jgi:hypothetical protein
MFLSKLSFRTQLIAVCLLFALAPLSVMMFVSWRTANKVAENTSQEYQSIAANLADKIDRNLFERYGDVQAFGLNEITQKVASWGVPGEDNPIVEAMNQYVDLYDVYYLTILVDSNGKVAAVNSTDSNGESINSTGLYDRDFSQAKWFKDAVEGNFYESADKKFTGTVVDDLYVDEDVKAIFGDEGLAMGFSAPVRNDKGEIIGVWRNVTKFQLVEDIVFDTYKVLKDRGLGSAELTILDGKGNVILDCDPTTRGTTDIVRDMAVIGKFNLAEKGVEAAQRVLQDDAGSITKSWHARKEIYQVAGYTPFRGAMGFPGMPWNALVRVSCDEALATSYQAKSNCLWTFGGALVVIVAGAY